MMNAALNLEQLQSLITQRPFEEKLALVRMLEAQTFSARFKHLLTQMRMGSVGSIRTEAAEQDKPDTTVSLKPALAALLYKEGVLSLGAAARISGLVYADFISHLADLDIAVVQIDETVAYETQDVSAWLKPS